MRILLIDDDQEDYLIIRDLLNHASGAHLAIAWEPSYSKAMAAIGGRQYDAYLVDYRLGEKSGLELISEAIESGCLEPMILLTGYGDHEVDVEAMKHGAADYLVKDELNIQLLERAVRYAVFRAESTQELREQKENNRNLFDSTFEGIIVHERDGTILETNAAACEILGCQSGQFIGANFYSFFTEGYREKIKAVAEENQNEDRHTTAARARRINGAVIDVELLAKPFHYRGRNVRLTTMRDVTARKQMEAQILVQDRLASVGLLASGLAHEIGTPLGVMRGRAEQLEMQLPNDSALRKNVHVIISQIDRVTKLIWSLLNLARGDELKGSESVSVRKVVSDVTELMRRELRKYDIDLVNDLKPEVHVAVSADAESLHQVILNLLVNAVHAIEEAVNSGRAAGHQLRISAEDRGNKWRLSFSDSGCGISEENMHNLFQPFFTTKDIGKGTGLGLATCYRITESWGGSIEVESQKDVGTTFYLSLPKAENNKL